jgi:ATP-dependent Clp protease ATP-binding subunit ClpC
MIQDALKNVFNPEFLNRIDDVITFKPLDKPDLSKIILNLVGELNHRVESLGYQLDLTDAACDFVAEKGYDPKFGARPLKRAIQRYIEEPLAETLLEKERAAGSTIKIKLNKAKDGLTFRWTAPKKGVKTTAAKNNESSDQPDERTITEAKKVSGPSAPGAISPDNVDSGNSSEAPASAASKS